jgi:hypothetical protein
MPDLIETAKLQHEVRTRYAEVSSRHAMQVSRYQLWHHYYAPLNGDQWPSDLAQRPGMIHMTQNVIRPVVDTGARVESALPRTSLLADSADPEDRKRAEAAEKMMRRFLELSGWEVWMFEAAKIKSIYGKTILHPLWVDNDKRPDVTVLENPANLRIGYGSSDFSVLDWTIYEYSVSPMEAMRRFKDVTVLPPRRGENKPLDIMLTGSDHSDPLGQLPTVPGGLHNQPRPAYQPSDYENKHVSLWDYWYKNEDGVPTNCVFLNGTLVQGPSEHSEYPDLPYIVIEHDHEPGSPEGLSAVEPLIDIQDELNRAYAHFAQLIADEVDPAFQLKGETADTVPPGLVPKSGEIIAAGQNNEILPILKGANQFPIQALIDSLYKNLHFTTGLSEIMFSLPPGAQTAGRALAIQIEASANRIGPRRNRLYEGVLRLLIFWAYMLEKKNPKFKVGENGEEAGVGDLVRGFRRWKFVAPEITPRDNIEHTTNVINQLQAKLIDLESAIDAIGGDSPLETIKKIMAERVNPQLFPGDAQAFMATIALLIQLVPQLQQAGIQLPGVQLPGGTGQQQVDAQNAQPTLGQEDNQGGPPQPTTPPGLPGGAAGLQNQSLIRSTPTGGAQALQQIRTTAGG